MGVWVLEITVHKMMQSSSGMASPLAGVDSALKVPEPIVISNFWQKGSWLYVGALVLRYLVH